MLRSLLQPSAFRRTLIRPPALSVRCLSVDAAETQKLGGEKDKGYKKPGFVNRNTWAVLDGVPKTCLPADIWRAIERAGVGDVVDVKLEYHNYSRNHRAWLQFSSPETQRAAVAQSLHKISISSLPITHFSSRDPTYQIFQNGSYNPGRDVLLRWSHKMTIGDVEQHIYECGFNSKAYTVRPVKANGFACFIVRLDSVSEAYRLTRQINLPKGKSGLIPGVRAQILH
ncbi:hypothetical protein BOTBODRAFT_182602 [Botryobasidium botryosum FD-172 SS1]|uniref:Uncharacterized protein n=1 Tax=Botryobasidium botryosum (strain FD-172 SS1) TaxID=930990 RepID=A0A067MZZ9_BOTB1|nr:hypothetical protein BOTBODRAFT_182602 [Botryobasidium botryosum FD-172 SS1]